MKTLPTLGILSFVMLAPMAASQDDCVPTSVNPETYWQFDLGSQTFYIEERNSLIADLIPGSPAVPMAGLLTGDGTWIYEETNGLAGLQRGGVGLLGDWFPPGCDQDWRVVVEPGHVSIPNAPPCLIINEDPITDVTCNGEGPDHVIGGGKRVGPFAP